MKYTIQIVGVGGQGVLLASMVLGNAAMKSGYKVAMSEVHGMAQRGGSVLCTLRFGDDVISPLEAEGDANMIMGFEPVETCRYLSLGNKDTVVIMNLDPVYPSMVAAGMESYPEIDELIASARSQNQNVRTLEATSLAIEAGKAVAANAVMIGAVAGVKGFPLDMNVLRETLAENVPQKFLELNLKAFDLGFKQNQ
ncbi:indolepyruvate ferredoxin oxidoreductase subunit beta [Candidatus Methanarcanum hacksteinii]|uniref:indolepyruvate ferredoxin oxidoreductase subunit beta n=1 Tax=Candidatus Methanarcanum hacksteinii TaxID=2911857 RepID=UPI0037DD814D